MRTEASAASTEMRRWRSGLVLIMGTVRRSQVLVSNPRDVCGSVPPEPHDFYAPDHTLPNTDLTTTPPADFARRGRYRSCMSESSDRPGQRSQGPVLLRRAQIGAGTTDQRLLDSRAPSDWVHTDPWRVLRIQSEFVEGFGLLAELPKAVTVFGSARTSVDHPEYRQGVELGAALAQSGFAVITGGGPG